MNSSENLIPKRTRRILLVILASIAVYLLALVLTSKISSKQFRESALDYADKESYILNMAINVTFMSLEWIGDTFLSGVMQFEKGQYYKKDETAYIRRISIADTDDLTLEDCYSMLESFIEYNGSTVESIAFVFEPKIIPDSPEGVATCVTSHGGIHRVDLLKEYDVLHSGLYENLKETNNLENPHVCAGKISPDDATGFVTAWPIVGENGRMIGQMWLGISYSTIYNLMTPYLNENDRAMNIVDCDGRIVLSALDTTYNELTVKEIANANGLSLPPQPLSDIEESVKSGKRETVDFKYKGREYRTYIYPIQDSPYYLLNIKDISQVLEPFVASERNIAQVSVLSLILIISALTYLFFKFRKEDRSMMKIQNDLDLAKKIQRNILPLNPSEGGSPLPPEIDVYGFQQAANSVGGDLYDYTVKDGKFYFCIGDVSGNGIPAALMMSEFCSLLAFIIKSEDSPQGIVSTLNDTSTNEDEDMFCTMFVGILDLQSGLLEFCNAGHTRPALMHGEKVELLDVKANMPVYAYMGYPYRKETLQLSPGDTLLLYTDGITEAKSASNEFFSEQSLLEALEQQVGNSPEDITKGICTAVSVFSAGAEQYDDMTTLCINYKG